MLTTLTRMFVLPMALGAMLIPGVSLVHAEDMLHNHAVMQPAKATFAGDIYLLSTDPVSGEPLGNKPIIYQHEDRELRFADQKNLDAFKANPAQYLPKVDQQMIEQQLPFYPLDACPVSGDKLNGDMGKPVNMIYKNRLVRFCCRDCVKDFQKDPDKFIVKLNEAVIAGQGPSYPMTTCVVSGDKLGGDMGKPVDLVVGNRLVRFCCADCPKDFNKNPAKFLKMIDDAAKKKANEATPVKPGGTTDGHAGHMH